MAKIIITKNLVKDHKLYYAGRGANLGVGT